MLVTALEIDTEHVLGKWCVCFRAELEAETLGEFAAACTALVDLQDQVQGSLGPVKLLR